MDLQVRHSGITPRVRGPVRNGKREKDRQRDEKPVPRQDWSSQETGVEEVESEGPLFDKTD